jgi:hypothetical protein
MKRRPCFGEQVTALVEVGAVVAVAAVERAAMNRDQLSRPQPPEVVRDEALRPTQQVHELANTAVAPRELAEQSPPQRMAGQ